MKQAKTKKERVNVYQMVTDRVLEQLEKGIVPWNRPWKVTGEDGAISYVTRKPYSFLNQLLLGRTGEFLTFKQVKDRGGNIRKGAKAGMVVYYGSYQSKKEHRVEEDGTENTVTVIKNVPVLKYYHVFHIDDCEGIETKCKVVEQEECGLESVAMAEDIIAGYLARESGLRFQNDRPSDKAFYSPAQDMVTVPMMSQYDNVNEYYSTTFHELVHSTSKKSRCDRESTMGSHRFGSKDYSREELVAELGSAMLCHMSGVSSENSFNNSVAYLNGWKKKLSEDNKAIVWAASRSEKAARFIVGDK